MEPSRCAIRANLPGGLVPHANCLGGVAAWILIMAAVALPAADPGVAHAWIHSDSDAAPANPNAAHTWYTPHRSARKTTSDAPEIEAKDWNPLAKPAGIAKTFLSDHRVTTDLYVMFFDQYASNVREGQQNYGSFAWRSFGEVALVKESPVGESYLEWNLTGTVGLDYDQELESLSFNAGILSLANANVYPDSAAMDELYWQQVLPGGAVALLAGRINQSFHFDANRVANGSEQQLLSFSLMNNLSIPWPLYGGLGGVVQWEASEKVSVMFGIGDSSSDEPWGFWKTLDNNSWFELLELDFKVEVPALGKGQYRITPWHNRLYGEQGWGIGGSFDQELGLPWLVGFFRFGAGDEDVTPVSGFVSGGVGVEGPFGRSGDLFALGVAWSRPSPGFGVRDETLLEMIYRVRLTPSLELSPALQFVFDPAQNPGDDLIVVPGVRLALVF
ncbi:MAG: carbohydrate porin [Deltaproteobacteria bacterium]|nr:carbohydrate porin [Deltaproteobacteria bacterium]